MPSATHSGVLPGGRRRKPTFTTLAGSVIKRLEAAFTAWLDQNVETARPPATDPQHVLESIRAGDVVLVAGRTRMSRFIRFLSGSPWTHVALCLGRLEEYTHADPVLRDLALRHPTLRDLIERVSHGDPREPVLIEALLGRGTILTPLRRYRAHAVKICRPSSLSKQQVGRVIRFAVRHLGFDYDLRQILDLVRLAVPLPSFARRWRSSLFDPDYVASRRCICSTLLVQSFTSVAHPVVAVAAPHGHAAYQASLQVNPRIATPRDFDGSPYFEYLEFPPKSPAAAPARPVPRLRLSLTKAWLTNAWLTKAWRAGVWRARGAARPFAHPVAFPGQVLEPCYASVPLRPGQRVRGRS
ncbi:MAG: YiiX/YebB-like N1pC/P60 family cysteine hydrolase [Gammaproteobacteria bacterium]